MPWTNRNNDVFFQRCQSVAASMQNLREECARLKEIMSDSNTAIADDANFEAADATQLRNAVMIPFLAFFDGEAVATQDRSQLLSQWLIDSTA